MAANGYSVPPGVLAALKALGGIETDPKAGALTDLKNVLSVHFGGGTPKVPTFGANAAAGGRYFWEAIDIEKKYGDKSRAMGFGASQLVKAVQDLATAAAAIHDAYVKAETDLGTGAAMLDAALKQDLPKVNSDVAAGAQGMQQTGGQ